MTVLEQQVLVLNRQWQAINVITVQAALSMMAADAATGMNFEEGTLVPVRWTDWLAVDIRDGDDCLGTPKNTAFRYSLTMSRRRTIRSSKGRRPCNY
jgi:hypothetical protein